MFAKRNAFTGSYWSTLPFLVAAICLILLPGGLRQTFSAMAASDQPQAENTITIGVQAALSGGQQYIGWRQVNAVQLAMDEINAAGGVDIGGAPYTVNLVYEDSECRPEQADDAANALLGAGVVAVIGDTCNSSSFVAQEIFDAAGISMVSASSTSPQLTDQGYDTTFLVITRDDTWPIRAAEALYSTYAIHSVAIIAMEDNVDIPAINAFVDAYEITFGGTITSTNIIASADDINAALVKIQGEGAYGIYFPWNDATLAGQIALEASDLGMVDVPIFWDSMSEVKAMLNDYDTAAGAAAEMNYALFYYRDPSEMPGYAEFNADYVASAFPNYGDEAQTWGAFAYDAARIILEAIDRADSTDPADIRDSIAAAPGYEGVVGSYEGFDGKGDVLPQWGDMMRSLNGEWLSLHPDPATLPVYTYRTDNFASTTLASEWAWLNEDPTHWSLTANPGFLRITLQQTSFTNWLVQPTQAGDFDIQTSLLFTPTANYQIAGLLLYQANDTYLLLGRAFCGHSYPNCVEGNGIYFDHAEGGVVVGDNFAMRTAYLDHAFLRLIRQGENYTAYVSQDGADWWLVGRHVMGSGVSLSSMGLATGTGNQTVEGVVADFDFFQVGPAAAPELIKNLLPFIVRLPAR